MESRAVNFQSDLESEKREVISGLHKLLDNIENMLLIISYDSYNSNDENYDFNLLCLQLQGRRVP